MNKNKSQIFIEWTIVGLCLLLIWGCLKLSEHSPKELNYIPDRAIEQIN
jgi:hypothetical protein